MNDYRVNDDMLSRKHIKIEIKWRGTDFLCGVQDLSTNGSWLNGKPIAKKTLSLMKDGDILTIKHKDLQEEFGWKVDCDKGWKYS